MKRPHGTQLQEVIDVVSRPNRALSPAERLRCLDHGEVKKITGLSEATLYGLGASGEGPPRVKLSERRWGYPLGGLADWLANRTSEPSAAA